MSDNEEIKENSNSEGVSQEQTQEDQKDVGSMVDIAQELLPVSLEGLLLTRTSTFDAGKPSRSL